MGLPQLGSVLSQIQFVYLLWPATRLWASCCVERATLGVGLDVSGLALASTTVCVCNAEKCAEAPNFCVRRAHPHTREIAVPSGLGPSSNQSSQVKSSQVKSNQVKSLVARRTPVSLNSLGPGTSASPDLKVYKSGEDEGIRVAMPHTRCGAMPLLLYKSRVRVVVVYCIS